MSDAKSDPSKRRRGFLADYVNLIASRYLGVAVGAIRGVVVPALLEPAAYGTYKALLMIPPFVRAGHLGAVSGLSRQIPFYRGRQDEERLRRAVKVGYTFSIGSAILACIGMTLYGLAVDDAVLRAAIFLFLGVIVTEQQVSFRDTWLTGHERFVVASRLRLLQTIVGAAFAIAGAWAFGLLGLVAGVALAGLVSLFAFRRASGLGFPGLAWDPEITRELLSVGFPLLVTGLLANVLYSVDRLVILQFLGTEAMGFYALAITFVGYLNDLSTLASRVIFPRIVVKLGADEPLENVKKYVYFPMAATSYLFPFLIICVHFAGIWVFRTFFPKYVAGAAALEILTFVVLPHTHFLANMNLVVAMRRQAGMLWIYPASIVVTAGFGLGAVFLETGLAGIATSNVLGFLTCSSLLFAYTERNLLGSTRPLRRYLRCYGPTTFAALLIAAAELGLPDHRASLSATVLVTLGVLAAYAPIAWLGWRHDEEFRGFAAMFRRAGRVL